MDIESDEFHRGKYKRDFIFTALGSMMIQQCSFYVLIVISELNLIVISEHDLFQKN